MKRKISFNRFWKKTNQREDWKKTNQREDWKPSVVSHTREVEENLQKVVEQKEYNLGGYIIVKNRRGTWL